MSSYPQIIGAMSTATISSQLIRRDQGLTTYIFVSTLVGPNPNFTYKFKSDTERMQYNLGKAFAIGQMNSQNQ
jgi:hypothetical protein